jgi:fatty acid desaturase
MANDQELERLARLRQNVRKKSNKAKAKTIGKKTAKRAVRSMLAGFLIANWWWILLIAVILILGIAIWAGICETLPDVIEEVGEKILKTEFCPF